MVNLVVALSAEARPVIDRYQLRAETPGGGFTVFRGEGLNLVVSGMGKVAAAGAAAHLHACLGFPRDQAWLNVGIAGHRSRALGEAMLVHKATDAGTGRSHYPAFPFQPPCGTESLLTVDRPARDYPEGTACDMEGTGFFQTAVRFSTLELVHSLKVVSDNEASPLENITPAIARKLIASRLDLLEEVLEALGSLAAGAAAVREDPPHYRALLERWRFSFTERHQLRDLLQRRRALRSQADLPAALEGCRRGRDVLSVLEQAARACST